MNLLLLHADELDADGVAMLHGRRAEHLRNVIKPALGASLRAGVIDGARGTVIVRSIASDSYQLAFAPSQAADPVPPHALHALTVVLAVPRPKVLSRVIETLATFGVQRIVLTNSWRVDKAYLESPRMAAPALRDDCILGAEQGGHTRLPTISVYPRLMQMLDAEFTSDAVGAPGVRLVAHPGALLDACGHAASSASAMPAVLALGPEGGWIERELATLAERGFAPLWLSSSILRVETAVAAALAQLELAFARRGEAHGE